jgi:hypothetical protein
VTPDLPPVTGLGNLEAEAGNKDAIRAKTDRRKER